MGLGFGWGSLPQSHLMSLLYLPMENLTPKAQIPLRFLRDPPEMQPDPVILVESSFHGTFGAWFFVS